MNNDALNNKILEEIHAKKLRPRSQWYFLTEQWFFMTFIIIVTLIGSIAVTVSLFILTDHDWFAVSQLREGWFLHAIKTIPYVWLVILMCAMFLIANNIKKVGRGYRYASGRIILWSLGASLALGTVLFFAGAGAYLDNYFDHAIPAYRTVVSSNRDIWIYPEDGLLSGKVQANTIYGFSIVDSDGQPWEVTFAPDTRIDTIIMPGVRVKITGAMIDGSHFQATTVLPWKK